MAQYDRSPTSAGYAGLTNPMAGFAVMQSITHSMMRGNLEIMGLVGRRARAQLDLPKHMLELHSPAEAGQLGAQFWRDAAQDYMHLSQRLLGLWVEGMGAVGQGPLARQAAGLASDVTRPLAKAAETAADRMAEDPAEPWAWWRSLSTSPCPSISADTCTT